MKSYPCTVKNFLLMELANNCFYLKDYLNEVDCRTILPARLLASHLPWSKMFYPQLPTFEKDKESSFVFFEKELSDDEISSLIV